MIKIKDIKNAQVFYARDNKGKPYSFKAWQDAYINHEGIWEIDCTDSGDYCYTFTESDERILYLTKEEAAK